MGLFRSWEDLEEAIRTCKRCPLHMGRKNAVPGEGKRSSPLMFIGEAPGVTEDAVGRPFVGAAGALLTQVMEACGIPRGEVYITNVVKCRPPGNREPTPEEVEACSVYLESQILLLKPKLIVTLGNVAGRKVFSMAGLEWGGVMRMRGRNYKASVLGLEVSVIPTLHPAAALYNPPLRALLEEDMKSVRRFAEALSPQPFVAIHDERGRPKTLLDYVQPSNGGKRRGGHS